jgi:hypothetical protein
MTGKKDHRPTAVAIRRYMPLAHDLDPGGPFAVSNAGQVGNLGCDTAEIDPGLPDQIRDLGRRLGRENLPIVPRHLT